MTEHLESTATLLDKVKSGDDLAKQQLCHIYLPRLTRWAHGRLPTQVRDLSETDDMVQVTLIKALNKIDGFQPKHKGSFLAYLRKILLNNIRMEIRRFKNRKDEQSIESTQQYAHPSQNALEQALGTEQMQRYESALSALKDHTKEAVIMRIELGFTYPEIAAALSFSSANHARMTVSRAVQQMAQAMS